MKETRIQVTTKKVWNIKNLILNGIHATAIAIALLMHPIVETQSVGALP